MKALNLSKLYKLWVIKVQLECFILLQFQKKQKRKDLQLQ